MTTWSMHLTPAACVVRIFGGYAAVARVLDVNRRSVHLWIHRHKKSMTGGVPQRHGAALLEAAKLRGLALTAEDLIYGREVPDAPLAAAGFIA